MNCSLTSFYAVCRAARCIQDPPGSWVYPNAQRTVSLHGEAAGVGVGCVSRSVSDLRALAPLWWVVGWRLVGDSHVEDCGVMHGGLQDGHGQGLRRLLLVRCLDFHLLLLLLVPCCGCD